LTADLTNLYNFILKVFYSKSCLNNFFVKWLIHRSKLPLPNVADSCLLCARLIYVWIISQPHTELKFNDI
jgi:hypothetical protein